MYGYTEDEALKMSIYDIVPEKKKQETIIFMARIEKGDRIYSFKTQRRHKNGKILDVWLTVSLVEDDQGNPGSIVTIERDLDILKML